MPIRSPPTSTTCCFGNDAFSAGSSMFPLTPSTAGPSPRSSSRNAADTKSPACSTRSAPRRSSTHRAGSARDPRGRCVSEMTATRLRKSLVGAFEGAREDAGAFGIGLRAHGDLDAVGALAQLRQLEEDVARRVARPLRAGEAARARRTCDLNRIRKAFVRAHDERPRQRLELGPRADDTVD